MTRQILALMMLFLAVSSRADVSDSGNLTIGGNGVIQGTMTVQGGAFSVGGSTFAVLGGTVQVGGLLRVSNLGIQWNDGTISTTAASGSGVGDVILTATQTFSGASTFTSSVTVGPSLVLSTVSFSNVLRGNWSLIASTHPSGSTGAYFYGLVSTSPYGGGTAMYRLVVNLRQNTSDGIIAVRFSDDMNASSHLGMNSGYGNAAGTINHGYTAGLNYCWLSYQTGERATQHLVTSFEFAPQPSRGAPDSNIWGHNEFYSGVGGTGDPSMVQNGCLYIGSQPLKNIKVFTTSGTFTGDIALFVLLTP